MGFSILPDFSIGLTFLMLIWESIFRRGNTNLNFFLIRKIKIVSIIPNTNRKGNKKIITTTDISINLSNIDLLLVGYPLLNSPLNALWLKLPYKFSNSCKLCWYWFLRASVFSTIWANWVWRSMGG